MLKKSLATAPAVYAVSRDELKDWQIVEHAEDDTLIDGLIASATNMFELYTGRFIIAQEWDFYFDCFPPGGLEILTQSEQDVVQVQYYDEASALQTLNASNYWVDQYNQPLIIRMASNGSWPATSEGFNRVVVRLSLGFANAASVPEGIKTCLKLIAGELYKNREASAPIKLEEIPLGIKFHMNPFRVISL